MSIDRPYGVEGLIWIADRLLGPGGCPWDQEQTHDSLKKFLLEESYELFEAIDAEDLGSMKEELGDVLLQPIMHAQMEKLKGNFDIQNVAELTCEKLIRRHPHVFGDVVADSTEAVLKNWDTIKRSEKGDERSILAGVPKSLPSLLRAYDVSKRAARAGFEWPEIEAVWDKLHEEEAELREAVEAQDQERIEEEVGDLLFTTVNIARWVGVEPEESLRRMLNRFTERFAWMEANAEGPLHDLAPDEWDKLWNQAKVQSSKLLP